MHNKRQMTQYIGLSVRAKTYHLLRQKPDQNHSSRYSIDEYQDHDKDP